MSVFHTTPLFRDDGTDEAGGRTHGYLQDRNGQFYWIGFPSAVFTRAAETNARRDIASAYRLGLNEWGDIVGVYEDATGGEVCPAPENILGATPLKKCRLEKNPLKHARRGIRYGHLPCLVTGVRWNIVWTT